MIDGLVRACHRVCSKLRISNSICAAWSPAQMHTLPLTALDIYSSTPVRLAVAALTLQHTIQGDGQVRAKPQPIHTKSQYLSVL